MKTSIQLTFIFLLTGLAFVSCGDKYYYNENPNAQQIILSSRVTFQTQPRLQDDMIVSGQALSLFITPNGLTNEILYPNVNIVANGSGGFTSETMYYPLDGRNIDLYAVHPYSTSASLTTPLDFQVTADQRIQSNYLQSDLLHATSFNNARSTTAIGLTFSHKLAKLDFTIESSQGLDLSALNNVSIINTLPGTEINILNGNISAATGTPVIISAYGVAGSSESRTSVSDIHAIVVPQTIPMGTELFRFTIGNQSYVYTTDQAYTFEGGYQHAIKLTITATGIILDSSITPWEDGGSIGGGVTPE
ncbi:MAG: fimbrillin family protein [Bacteroides sp.]|nr:fimbrillin family protein [Bacteroides sp.]